MNDWINKMKADEYGIIGLGTMGSGMARNILAAGHTLKGFDLNPAALASFEARGGIAAQGLASVAADVRVLIVMVVNAQQVDTVLFGDGGAAASMPAGSTIMVNSTVAPADMRRFAAKAAKLGLLLLDAPVSGAQVGADAGTLTVMASGGHEAFAAAEPILKAISKSVYSLGHKPGIGSTYKIVHQLAAGAHLVVAAELMAFGAKAGCDPAKLYDVVSNSAGQSWVFNNRVPTMMSGDFSPRSTVDIFVKDMDLVLQTGREAKVPLPVSAACREMFVAASALGEGGFDDSSVVKAYEALTGVNVRAKK